MIFIEFAACGESHDEQHKAGARLAEKMIFKYTGCRCKYDEAERTAGGKPYFKSLDGVDFSVSHSGRLVMCALSVKNPKCPNVTALPPDGEIKIQNAYCIKTPDETLKVGADIEHIIDSRQKLERVSKRFFTSDENEYIHVGGFSPERFFEIWTKKESLGKKLGTGLSGVLYNKVSPGVDARYQTFRIITDDGKYIGSVCY